MRPGFVPSRFPMGLAHIIEFMSRSIGSAGFPMLDLVLLASGVAFLLTTAGYADACQWL